MTTNCHTLFCKLGLLVAVAVTIVGAGRQFAWAASVLPIWGMEGGDPGHTNQSSLLAPQTNIKKMWKVDLGADSFCQPVIGADGTIYVTNELGQLIAVSPQGQKLWTFSGASIKATSPAIGNDGTIYFGTGESVSNGGGPSYAYAVNPNGSQRWQVNVGNQHPYDPLIDSQGRIHFANYNYSCLNADGSVAWSSTVRAESTPALLPNGNSVFQSTTNFRCCDSSGGTVWTTRYGYSLDPPIVTGNGNLYAGCYDPQVWKIDPATGATLQTINTGYRGVKSLSIDDDAQRLYVSGDSILQSFDLSGKRHPVIDVYSVRQRPPTSANVHRSPSANVR